MFLHSLIQKVKGKTMKEKEIEKARQEALKMLEEAGLPFSKYDFMEITDFGQNRYREIGLGLMIRVDEEEYASKWLTLLPRQKCPAHHHKQIKETFIVMRGDVEIIVDSKSYSLNSGDKVTIEFSSKYGAIIEEITTRQVSGDSYFKNHNIKRYVEVE
jgi:mannose-6-phosphate isomerase-like protein (cupin superfamily)